jgi:hypothetical protein
VSGEVNLGDKAHRVLTLAEGLPTVNSMGGSGVQYHQLTVKPGGIYCGSILLLTLATGGK